MPLPNNANTKVDQNELRTQQALGGVILLSAFVLQRWELVAVQASILFIASLLPRMHPYRLVYLFILLPMGIVKPDRRTDHSAAHRFASFLGFVMTTIASYLLANHYTWFGWGLVWIVIVLTGIAILGWCAGCFTYYTLHRLGLTRLFRYAPVACTFPGARPSKNDSA